MHYSKIRDVQSPFYATEGSAGIDFYVPKFDKEFINEFNIKNNEGYSFHDGNLVVHSGYRVLIPSGIKVHVPYGYALIGFNKSGIASKYGLILGPQVIDSDYQGEVYFGLINTSNKAAFIKPDMKIIQLVLLPVARPDVLDEVPIDDLYVEETTRGVGGFGSTGE